MFLYAAARPICPAPARVTELSVVIPAYNEAGSLGPLVDEIRACFAQQGLRGEIVVVDDGSTDGTLETLAACRGRPGLTLRVLRHLRNYGQSAALLTGVRAARHEWILMLDGDGQNDPADVAILMDALDRHSGKGRLRLVCGHRVERRDSAAKRLSSRIANAVRGRLLGDGTPDTGCGLKLIHRETFLALPYFDHMHRFLPALVQRNGDEVVSVVVSHRRRFAGRSKYGVQDRLWVGLIDLMGVAWLQRRGRRPEHVEVE